MHTHKQHKIIAMSAYVDLRLYVYAEALLHVGERLCIHITSTKALLDHFYG